MTKEIVISTENNKMSITLNRPESLNALNRTMINDMTNAFRQAERDPSVRIVMLQGAGRAFSSGGDIKGMGNQQGFEVYEHLEHVRTLIETIYNLKKPVIANVHGYAAGVAFSLALACDLIIAEKSTKFMMSFSKIGLISDGGGSYFLTKLVGPQRAKQILFSAEPVDASKAYEWGIVNEIYEADESGHKIETFIQKFINGPGKSYEMLKKLVNEATTANLTDILELETLMQTMMKSTEDHQEGIQAFKEKRQPNFIGK